MKLMQDLTDAILTGRYRLVARLAGGGMGEVYRAHDLLLDRAVAVKVLQPSFASEPDLVERFKDEARAAARLSHPNVVAVYDWGCEAQRTYFMVMEYVAGTDLRDVLVARGSLEPVHAAEIVASVCDALAEAHASGLVHRDVKPENVLIAREGRVKVADFGIAVIADADLTLPAGVVPGTLRYLSPEQARGGDATGASDIWAAGAVLGELLTGSPPLQGAGGALLRRRATEPPIAPSRSDGRVPRVLDDVVLRACALEPAQRYPNAGEMAGDIRRALARSLPEGPPLSSLLGELTAEIRLPETAVTSMARPRRRLRTILKSLGAALLAALVVAAGISAAELVLEARKVEVPDIVGATASDARAALDSAGLDVKVGDLQHHFGTRRGQVMSQRPDSGRVPRGTPVRLVVSAGLPLVAVPSVVGSQVVEAGGRLHGADLEVGRITKIYSHRPEGAVVAQTPSEQRLRWGGKVDLVVSKGRQPVAVPALAGSRARRARARLRSRRLEVTVTKRYSNDVAVGDVVSTTPPTGAVVPQGSHVRLYVSKGPRFARLTMPDVRNMSITAARSKLSALGLRSRVVQSCGGGGKVVETDPLQGARTHENRLVALFVC